MKIFGPLDGVPYMILQIGVRWRTVNAGGEQASKKSQTQQNATKEIETKVVQLNHGKLGKEVSRRMV